MRKWLWPAMAAAVVMAVPLTANAAEKINSVSISFHAEDSGEEGTGCGGGYPRQPLFGRERIFSFRVLFRG